MVVEEANCSPERRSTPAADEAMRGGAGGMGGGWMGGGGDASRGSTRLLESRAVLVVKCAELGRVEGGMQEGGCESGVEEGSRDAGALGHDEELSGETSSGKNSSIICAMIKHEIILAIR